MPPRPARLPDWDALLSALARRPLIIPNAVLDGTTAAAGHAGPRTSLDNAPVRHDLQTHYAAVMADLEAVAGWQLAPTARAVMVPENLDGIETCVRQLRRTAPLETETLTRGGVRRQLPTGAETLRLKAVLILKRNATRDYVDFAVAADRLGAAATAQALAEFDRLYPQPNGESALQQLLAQLAAATPYDLAATNLSECQQLDPKWQPWQDVRQTCAEHLSVVFNVAAERTEQAQRTPPPPPSSPGSMEG